jgi:hypothetical protein
MVADLPSIVSALFMSPSSAQQAAVGGQVRSGDPDPAQVLASARFHPFHMHGRIVILRYVILGILTFLK